MLDTDLAWLAGLLDGEGSINFNISQRPQISVQVNFTNTNELIIAKCQNIITDMRLPSSRCENQNRVWSPHRKRAWVIAMSGQENVLDLLAELRPYVAGKRPQLDLISAFCTRRLETLRTVRREHRASRNEIPYTQWDIDAVNEMRALNFRGRLQDGVTMPKLVGLKPTAWSADGMLFRNYQTALSRRDPIDESFVSTYQYAGYPRRASTPNHGVADSNHLNTAKSIGRIN